jgi:subtilisin family serine protease
MPRPYSITSETVAERYVILIGRQWQEGDPCNPYPSLSDHGTHVAGTVAARFDGGRVVGVAPNASLANHNVFEMIPDVGVRSYSSSRWRAMMHAADNGVHVINMSLGSVTFIGNDPKRFAEWELDHDPTRQNWLATSLAAEKRIAGYMTSRGTVIVSSAGNSASKLNGNNIASPGQTPGQSLSARPDSARTGCISQASRPMCWPSTPTTAPRWKLQPPVATTVRAIPRPAWRSTSHRAQ